MCYLYVKGNMSINKHLVISVHFSIRSENKGKQGGEKFRVGLCGAGYKCSNTAGLLYQPEAVILTPECLSRWEYRTKTKPESHPRAQVSVVPGPSPDKILFEKHLRWCCCQPGLKFLDWNDRGWVLSWTLKVDSTIDQWGEGKWVS